MKTTFLLFVAALSAHSALAAECLASTPIVHTTTTVTGMPVVTTPEVPAVVVAGNTVTPAVPATTVDPNAAATNDIWVPSSATDFTSDCTCAVKATVDGVEVVSLPLKFKCSYAKQSYSATVGDVTTAGTSEGAVYSCTTEEAYETAVATQKTALKVSTDVFKAAGTALGETMAEIASTCVKVSTTGTDGAETTFGPAPGTEDSAGAMARAGTVAFAVVGALVGMLQQ